GYLSRVKPHRSLETPGSWTASTPRLLRRWCCERAQPVEVGGHVRRDLCPGGAAPLEDRHVLVRVKGTVRGRRMRRSLDRGRQIPPPNRRAAARSARWLR